MDPKLKQATESLSQNLHDLRSPLVALKHLVSLENETPEHVHYILKVSLEKIERVTENLEAAVNEHAEYKIPTIKFEKILKNSSEKKPIGYIISDDLTLQIQWEETAKKEGYQLESFNSSDYFLSISKTLNTTFCVFLDENLYNSEFTNTLAKEGFQNIYVVNATTTGTSPEIKGYVGKKPPQFKQFFAL